MKIQFKLIGIIFLFFSALMSCNNNGSKNGGISFKKGPQLGYGVDNSGNEKYIQILQKTLKYNPDISACKIYLKVKNTSDYLCSYSHFVASLYDSNGSLLGTAIGNGINIPAGKEKTVDLTAGDVEMPSKYEIQIEDVIFQ